MERLLRALAWLVIVAGLVVVVARYTVIRWWQVPLADPVLEASVEPTLRGGDWILLWRLTKPGFGDLVVCEHPEEAGAPVIGRIAGEAGDTVKIAGSDVAVNNSRVTVETSCPDRLFSVVDPSSGETVDQHCSIEVMGGVRHFMGMVPRSERPPTASSEDVPEDHVYLVSDNRLFPYDSRTFGAVPGASCKETVFFRLVSKDGFLDVKNRLSLVR